MKTEWTVVRITFMQVVTNLCLRRDHQGDGTCFHGNYQHLHCEAFSSSSQCNCYPIHLYGLEQSNKFKMSATLIICEYLVPKVPGNVQKKDDWLLGKINFWNGIIPIQSNI